MPGHSWRWWVHAIHRDVGYVCVGLVLVYAISGIAVNHVDDWNPSYSIARVTSRIAPIAADAADGASDDALAKQVLAALELDPTYRTLFVPEPGTLRIVRENHTIDAALRTGEVVHEIVTPRPVLHAANFLHLNHAKRAWTFVADAFAVALIVLALTGMFMLRGKNGLAGRGKWLVGAGVALPLVFVWLYV